MTSQPTPPVLATDHSPQTSRWAAAEQPNPVPNPKGSKSQQWRFRVVVWRMGSGKASATRIEDHKRRWFFAPTHEDALVRQREFVADYLNPSKRQRCRAAGWSDQSSSRNGGAAEDAVPSRPKRTSAPKSSLSEVIYPCAPHKPRAGPGVSANSQRIWAH